MISLTGMPTLTALKVVDATEAKQQDLLRADRRHARAIEHFETAIKDVETVDQLMEDYELYSFVMTAFDLEDQIFGKAMMSKILKSNVEDDKALINRMADPRFRALYDEMGFGTDGVGNLNTLNQKWRDGMVDRYIDRLYLNDALEQNQTLGTVLDFRRKVADLEKPLDVLKDRRMSEFFRTTLGLPAAMAGLDLDRQIGILTDRFDFEKLKDPVEVDRMINRYIAISDATKGVASVTSGAITLMQGAVSSGQRGGGFLPAVIDIAAIQSAGIGYRNR